MQRQTGWSYSYFASAFLSVHPYTVREGLGRANDGSWHACLFRVPCRWFVRLLAAQGSKTMPVLSTVEAQLSLHKRNITKAAPEAWKWQEAGD